jgi:aldehyde:ferredoxin oxidoreductase
MDPSCDPLGPGNILGFAAGYLTGTGAYIASRFMCFGKSPSTKGWGDANCGGHFGKGMKQAGVDVILLSGLSEAPVVLVIEDGNASLEPADGLWGKDCYETEDALKEQHGKDCQVACIGPAGENMSNIAGISTDKGRFAARSALGAVMGSKKLKAVVVKGNRKIELADPDRMKELRKEHLPQFREGFGEVLGKYGTPMFYEGALNSGDAPFKNWSSSVEEMADFAVTADKVLEYQVKKYACNGCPVGCGGHVEVNEGEFKTDGPIHKVEYETMGLFGSNLLLDDVEALIKINDLCNRYGMDTIGCGGLVGYAIECLERGLISSDQADGLDLSWGNASAIVALVDKIGKAEGIGKVLSSGFEGAVREFGEATAPYAMAVRGEGLPSHDPRWNVGIGLTYYLDPTPARHCQGSTTFPLAGYEMPEIPADQAEGRGEYHKDNANWTHVLNSAGLCLFGYFILSYKTLPDYLSAADGTEWTMEELEKMGERLTAIRQIFNIRAGQSIGDYGFPERAMGNPPLETGPTKGVKVDIQTMLREYFEAAGFDEETGLPSREVLESLHLVQFL